ncbi:MAG: hypothetical protein SF339_21740 [Blastocatellia bacterium]|nr:hypothetical protein [Blastocatellia bacterium]
MSMNPEIIVIAGTGSNTGKTTLLCELLRELGREAPWEAIKLTRGHYRSCGKDPHACCVSDLLGEAPTVRSGRDATYVFGKDTGRFWDAGARNVHWVIATDAQVEQGVREALGRVVAPHALIEGTSVLKFLRPALALLTATGDEAKIKPSARTALAEGRIDAVYLFTDGAPPASARALPVFRAGDLAGITALIRERLAARVPPS